MADGKRTELPEPDAIRRYYDSHMREVGGEYIARRWQATEAQRRHYRQTRSVLDALLALHPLGEVLEIGCGPGVWTELLVGRASRATLVDISAEMLAKARERIAEWDEGRFASLVSYHNGDFLETPVGTSTFDTILSMRAFEYVTDKRTFVQRCFAALRPGGRLLLGTKNGEWYDAIRARRAGRDPAAERAFQAAMQSDLVTSTQLRQMLADAGFRDVTVFPLVFGSYHRPLRSKPGLLLCDFLHRMLRRRPMGRLWSPLAESVIAVGRRRSE